MAIPTKGLNQLRTLSGRVDQLSLPYRSYMQITCLEMERARRNMERKSASKRVALIDTRIEEIEKSKQDLLLAVATSGRSMPARRSTQVPANRHRRSFRSGPASTGAPLARAGSLRLIEAWLRLFDAESRRLWLEARWRAHLGRVRAVQVRSRS